MLRGVDRRCGAGLSRYGWAFRFGNVAAPPAEVWVNVCVRCGSGHSEPYLRKFAPMRKGRFAPMRKGKDARIHKWAGLFPAYRCPACGGFNFLTPEFTPRA